MGIKFMLILFLQANFMYKYKANRTIDCGSGIICSSEIRERRICSQIMWPAQCVCNGLSTCIRVIYYKILFFNNITEVFFREKL